MTDWNPPIDGGLYGGVYPIEQVAAFCDDGDDPTRPGIYVIKLSQPDDFDVAEQRFRRAYADAEDRFKDEYADDLPEWVREAFEAETVLYVGAAADVLSRINDHADGKHTASVCKVYPPHSVWDVEWYDDADRAFERESMRAIALRNAHPSLFIAQN